MPKVSCRTFANGARQLVVHDAFEMMLCLAGSYELSFTPSTMVMSSPDAGAEMMTFFTEPRRCFFASSAAVKRPVDSTTTSTPSDGQSISAGSFGREHPDLFVVDVDMVAMDLHVGMQPPEHGIVLRQMRESRGVGQIVDGHEFEIGL